MPRNILSVINGMKKYVPSEDDFGLIKEFNNITDRLADTKNLRNKISFSQTLD